MKKIINCLGLLIIFFSYCCTRDKTAIEIENNRKTLADLTNNYKNECDTLMDNNINSIVPFTDIPNHGISYLYLIDSSCSKCIFDYILFASYVSYNNDAEVFGVVNRNDSILVDYHIDEFMKVKNIVINHTLLTTTEKYPYDNSNKKNVMVIKNASVIDSFAFIDNTVIR